MVHDFAMNPRSDVPRSAFALDHSVNTTFSFSYLVPILVEEVLPGDTWNCGISTAARTAVPIVPIQDNWHLEFFSFFVPMRLVWNNAARFWGEQDNPGDSTSYTIPTMGGPESGANPCTLQDYMGIPGAGQVAAGENVIYNVLPFRAYNLIWNQWFRDENLQNSRTVPKDDGPDSLSLYDLLVRPKRYDYFTQALPWPQKGNTAISVPLGGSAPVVGVAGQAITFADGGGAIKQIQTTSASTAIALSGASSGTGGLRLATSGTNIIADLTTATAATINQLRQAITLQQYLEKDARGGTRYTEFVYNHFGVRSADARLQRPEFIGGGRAPILTQAIPQTSATGITGSTTPAGNLAASGYVHAKTGFTYSATEHGFILTLVSARADLKYQQGLRKMWSRSTRYDYPVPLLAGLGEQALQSKEIYCDGTADDNLVFGYVPRFDEYRHIPSRITGLYKSYAAGTIDYWHSAQKFANRPTLNASFIEDDAKNVTQRNFSAGAATAGQQILADFFFSGSVARALPAYGVPGLTRF